jgi:sulfite reductase alpha subunit-like flavoprotein
VIPHIPSKSSILIDVPLLIQVRFNWAHRKLYNRLIQLGAQPVNERGESDEQHPEGIDGTFLPWSLGLRQRLLDLFPLPKGQDAIPDNMPLEPRWSLSLHTDIDGTSLVKNPIGNGITSQIAVSQNASSANPSRDKTPPDDLLDIPNALIASVESNARLTPSTHWQDVRQLTLSLQQSRSYNPGDVLTIYPKNFPSDVDHFLTFMDWISIADKPVRFVHNPQRTPETNLVNQASPPIQLSDADHVFTLRELLTNHLDIMSIPRRSFFSQLLHYTNDPFHRERLQEFTNPEFIDELYDYTTRPRRSILEVLDEFSSVKIPWQKVCSVVPKIRGRQFSIASGGMLKFGPHSPSPSITEEGVANEATKVELLIAIVKYRTVIKRIRLGVATRYIASLRPGQRISVTLEKGGLGFKKEDVSRPVVMIGPGTGVAPMRNLIYERMAVREQMGISPPTLKEGDILFYGCRNREADFFFRDEWDHIREKAGLLVFVAFSRDQVS